MEWGFLSNSDQVSVVYLAAVFGIGLFAFFWSKRHLLRLEKLRLKRIRGIKRFEATKTSTPVDAPVQESKDAASENIRSRFSIIRKTTYISGVVIWLAALSLPFIQVFPATLISVIVGSSGIILGLAARPVIENMISGIVISFSQPFRIGDTLLIDGVWGTVEDINMSHTVIKTWDWKRLILSNSGMLSKEYFNLTIHDNFLWAYVVFDVAYDADLSVVKKIAIESAYESQFFYNCEAPRFWVMDMGQHGVECWIAAWAKSVPDLWELRSHMRAYMVKEFNRQGIKVHRYEINRTPVAPLHPAASPSPAAQASPPPQSN